jgi:hypothetical protein
MTSLSKMLSLGGALAALALLPALGCGGDDDDTAPTVDGSTPTDDAAIDGGAPAIDAPPPIDAAPPDAALEPTPAFTASQYVSGQLAITQDGLRDVFSLDGSSYYSVLVVSLTEDGASTSCEVMMRPHFVEFSTGSSTGRYFKTAVLDLAQSTVLQDGCHWDDSYITSQLAIQWGTLELGFAKARFEEDRPNVDVFIDAVNPFGNDTDLVVLAGGGAAFPMDDTGVVDGTVTVEPEAGTLATALYQW